MTTSLSSLTQAVGFTFARQCCRGGESEQQRRQPSVRGEDVECKNQESLALG